MNLLFLRQPSGFIYYDDAYNPESNFPTELINILDELEDTINKRLRHKPIIFNLVKGVFFMEDNPDYLSLIDKEMKLYCNAMDFSKEHKVFAGRPELLYD